MGARLAIVGLSCRFAGAAGPDAFWRMLVRGEASERRALDTAPGETPVPPACLLPRAPLDGAFFECGGPEAEAIADPHRLALELAVEALEDAGMPLTAMRGTRAAVFVGGMWHAGPADLQRARGPNALSGRLAGALAGRIAHHLDLRGPAVLVDTATSSALVAVHLAAQAIRSGETPIALAGGVNLIDADGSAALWRLGVLSPGEIRPFDGAADGYVRGEGGGFVVLKPLRRALVDRDRVYAVLRGSAVTHEGAGRAIVAPSVAGQVALLESAYAAARTQTAQIDYLEAHGTGTPQGDRHEAEALAAVCGARPGGARPLLVGSVKANVGHLEGAAGIAGVIKTALALYHEYLPATPNCSSPSSAAFDRRRLALQMTPDVWPRDGSRLAGVTSLGLCGSNCHVVLQGRQRRHRGGASRARVHGHHLLVLSARTPEALRLRAEAMAAWCESGPEPRLRDVCFTAAVRQSHYARRLAIVCTTYDDCARGLRLAAASPRADRSSRPALVFAFGAHQPGSQTSRQLGHRLPGMRRARLRDAPPARGRTPEDATLVDVAAYFCRLGLAPDRIATDDAGEAAAARLARTLGVPLSCASPVQGPSVVLRFGACEIEAHDDVLTVPILPSAAPLASVLEGVGALYALGFDPAWPRLYGRGAVVSLPVHTWDRTGPARGPEPTALRSCIHRHLDAVLQVPHDALDDTAPLIALGVDSLGALELEERLRTALGVDVGILRALDEITIEMLETQILAARERLDAVHA